MATFVVLARYTHQGVEHVKASPERLEAKAIFGTASSPAAAHKLRVFRGGMRGFMRMQKVFSAASSLTPKASIAACASYIGQKVLGARAEIGSAESRLLTWAF